MSYHQILYHIIFGTKFRKNTISPEHAEELYKYIGASSKTINVRSTV